MRKLFLVALLAIILSYWYFSSSPANRPGIETEKKTMSFWGIYDLPEVYQPLIHEFESSHPGIKVVYKQFADRQEYDKLLGSQLEEGRGPDILLFDQDQRDEMEPYLIPTGAPDIGEFPPFVKTSFVSGRLLYALPLWVDSLMIYYNKRYYPEGIKPQWHDFAEQTLGISIGGVAMGRLDNLKSGWDILKALFVQKGIFLTGKAENDLFDTLEFFTRFAIPTDRYFNWNENLSKNYPDQEIDSFVRGKVAAIAGYGSIKRLFTVKIAVLRGKNIPHMKDEDIGVGLFPQFTPDHPRFLSKYLALGVSVHSQVPNEAWEFIRLLTDRKHATYYFQATGRTPGRFLPVDELDSAAEKIQKLELPDAVVYPLSPESQEKLAKILEKGLKNKNALREVLQFEF